jgi:hypothetical protein
LEAENTRKYLNLLKKIFIGVGLTKKKRNFGKKAGFTKTEKQTGCMRLIYWAIQRADARILTVSFSPSWAKEQKMKTEIKKDLLKNPPLNS